MRLVAVVSLAVVCGLAQVRCILSVSVQNWITVYSVAPMAVIRSNAQQSHRLHVLNNCVKIKKQGNVKFSWNYTTGWCHFS